jgi:hypothetical protein
MDPFTLILALAGGAIGIWSSIEQGKSERKQAQLDHDRAMEQVGWTIEDTEDQRDKSLGSMNAAMAASGIGGDSAELAMGHSAGEYNRVISQLDTKKDWATDDLNTFLQQSKVNQAFNIGSSLLTTAQSGYQWGVNQNLWGPGAIDPFNGSVVQPYFKQDKATRGSLFNWTPYGGY